MKVCCSHFLCIEVLYECYLDCKSICIVLDCLYLFGHLRTFEFVFVVLMHEDVAEIILISGT